MVTERAKFIWKTQGGSNGVKIAVFNFPSGVTAEGLVQAFLDAGLPRPYLQKELRKHFADKQAKKLTLQMLKALEQARIPLTLPSPPQGERAGVRRFSPRAAVRPLMAFAETAIAIQYFQIKKCFLRNLAIGRRGNPRTLKLLRGFILERLAVNQEIVSPEGAAILSVLCEKEISIPAVRLEKVGFGPDRMQVSIGETVAPYRRERVLLLETNIDDMSPQGFELVYERLFKAGALDVWVQPILMKKMRPAFKLSVLLNHDTQEKISEVIFRETPSLGVRFLELDRFSLPRKIIRAKTRLGPVRFKIIPPSLFTLSPLGGEGSEAVPAGERVRGYPEYEDLKRIARKRKLPFRFVQKEIQKGPAR